MHKQTLLLLLFSFSMNLYSFEIFRLGNEEDAVTKNQFYACMAGGGNDDLWVEGWIKLLNSTKGGDVLIVREDDRKGYYGYWLYNDPQDLKFPRVNSVSTLVLHNKDDGNNPEVIKAFQNAEFVFFTGGFQNNYVDYLRGTKALTLLQQRIREFKVSIAGTSAGMAIMGEFNYASHYSSPRDEKEYVSAEDVLNNPTGKFVDIEEDLLSIPYLENVITDTHFTKRNRQGRLVGFMANASSKVKNPVNGIGVDESTAFCFDEAGMGKVYGSNSVYFLTTPILPTVESNKPLLWSNIQVYKLQDGEDFFLESWSTENAKNETWSIINDKGMSKLQEVTIPDEPINLEM